jgi:hypothetical protein
MPALMPFAENDPILLLFSTLVVPVPAGIASKI